MKPSEYSRAFGLGPDAPAAVDLVHLKRVLMGDRRILGGHALARLKVDVEQVIHGLAHDMLVSLRTTIVAQPLEQTTVTLSDSADVEFETWATWWDHFKADQREATSPLWRWVARRWPPKTVITTKRLRVSKDYTLVFEALFPDAEDRFSSAVVSAPGLGQGYPNWRAEPEPTHSTVVDA